MYLIMYILVLFFMYSRLAWAAKPNTNCGQNGNLDTICSPITGDTWRQNGTYYLATWNPLYPTYVSSSSLSIYIYFVEHYEKINVISYHNIPNTGGYPILINSTWFDSTLNLQESHKYDALFYLISSELNPVTEMNNLNSAWPSATSFSVESSSSPSSPTSNQQGVNPTASSTSISTSIGPAPWVTPLIVIGCLLLLLGCITAFYLLRILRRRKLVYDEKSHTEYSNSKSSTNYRIAPSSSSSDPFSNKQHHHDDDDRQQQQTMVSSMYSNLASVTPPPATLQSMSSLSSRSDPPLTSTDAILIADTFRQRMRHPNWPHCSDIVKGQQQSLEIKLMSSSNGADDNADDESDHHARRKEEEEMKRQLASELLLKNELEAEGTLMKKVGKRAHLLSTIQFSDPSANSPH